MHQDMDDALAMFLWLGAAVVVFLLLAFAANFAVKILQPHPVLRRLLIVAFSGVIAECAAALVATGVIFVEVPMRSGRRFFGIDWTEWVIIAAAVVGFMAGCTLPWFRTRARE